MSAFSSPGHTHTQHIKSYKISSRLQASSHTHAVWMICLFLTTLYRLIAVVWSPQNKLYSLQSYMSWSILLNSLKRSKTCHYTTAMMSWFAFWSWIVNITSCQDISLVLTCWVHDVVHQVCEPGRGLVRQQVGEKIPEARQRQLIQTDRNIDKPNHIEHDLSHTGVKQTYSIKLSKIKKKERHFFHWNWQFIHHTPIKPQISSCMTLLSTAF